jgi:ferredoxin
MLRRSGSGITHRTRSDISIRSFNCHKFTAITLHNPVDKTLAEALLNNGVFVKQKCSDGLCGWCSMGCLIGDGQHWDFVLAKKIGRQK